MSKRMFAGLCLLTIGCGTALALILFAWIMSL